MKIRYIRYGILTVITGMIVYVALGYGDRSFEAFCPFGGAEAMWGLLASGEFTCALGPLNLSLFIAAIVLALIAKKSFCGWACPIGFLSEIFGRLGAYPLKGRCTPKPKVNASLKILRYVVLVGFLFLTYKTGELVLRGYDPFYLIFSGFGHGTLGWISYVTLGALIVGAILIPMFFCRYLCPLGAVFDPFSLLGVVRIKRNHDTCTDCIECDLACPHDIPVSQLYTVRARDCTNCLECIEACPEAGVLTLQANL